PIAMICAAAAIWLASKTYIVIAIAMVGTCILETIRGGQPTRSVAGTAVIAAVIFAVAFGCFELLRGTVSSAPIPDAPHAAVKTAVPGVALTSVESSGARRLDLWREGLSAGLDRFPVGIGLGQFNAVVASGMPEAYLRSTSPHNTALTLFIEMGAVGLALLGATAVIVWRAVGGFPPIIAVMIFLLLGPSAVLHDVQGMRILLLLVALGLARRTPAGHSTG
ncbi:MAG: O-antigen ligase family protein, partial [Alphaproteobacteria bacterium]